MAQPQTKAMGKDPKDSPEWVVIADDWVDIDDKMDDDDDDDDFDQAKSKNELNDHVKSPVVAENENPSAPKVMTRYVDVPEERVKFFTGKDVVMDLQIASGAMIQITKAYDVDAKFRPVRMIGNLENVEKAEKLIKAYDVDAKFRPVRMIGNLENVEKAEKLIKAYDVDAKFRPVRMIGNLENVEKAEKLIKAVVALADAGGSALLRKNECDSGDYGTRYDHCQKQESWYRRDYLQYPDAWGPFQFDRKRSHKRSHGRQ